MGMELTTEQLQQPIMVVQDLVAMVEATVVPMEVTLPLGQVMAPVMVVLYMEQVHMVPMGHMRVHTEVVHMAHLAAMEQAGMVPMGELEAWVVGARVAEARAGTTHMANEFTAGSYELIINLCILLICAMRSWNCQLTLSNLGPSEHLSFLHCIRQQECSF
jgi:hypothetical protein